MFKLSGSNHVNFASIFKKGKNILNELPAVKRLNRWQKINNFLKYLSIALILLCAIVLIFFSVHFVNVNLILSRYLTGHKNAVNAALLLGNGDHEQAFRLAKFAANDFSESLEIAEEYSGSYLVKKTRFFSGQLNDLFYLLGAGELMARAIEGAADYQAILGEALGDQKLFSTSAVIERTDILQRIHSFEPDLNGIRANIDLALSKLEKIEFIGVLWLIKDKTADLEVRLKEVRDYIDRAARVSGTIPPLLGYPEEARYLLVFEDTGELWPTGGRMKNFGVLRIKNGEIIDLKTYGVEEFSALTDSQTPVSAPESLKLYRQNGPWTIKDANWSLDWPSASGQIIDFVGNNKYLRDLGFTGAIAVMPQFLSDLLTLNGPIKINDREYDESDMALLFNRENSYDIGPLVVSLRKSIGNGSLAGIKEAYDITIENLEKKNILVNFFKEELGRAVASNNWDGAIQKNASSDYLAVVDTNLGDVGDLVMNRGIEYRVEEKEKGLYADLYLNYAHNGSEGEYEGLVQVFVPLGSRFTEFTGLEDGTVVTRQESNSCGGGFDKMVLAGLFRVKPGEIKQVHLSYKLPSFFNLEPGGYYTLRIQKQPGNHTRQLTVDVNLLNKVKSYKPTGYDSYREGDGRIKWQMEFDADRIFFVGL
ncbi:MAG: DUF4012 domain-containing protein [Candidatus Falkowbacteria bacterium]